MLNDMLPGLTVDHEEHRALTDPKKRSDILVAHCSDGGSDLANGCIVQFRPALSMPTGDAQPLVESYWRLAWQWRDEVRGHNWAPCGCLYCADIREHLGMKPLSVRMGSAGIVEPPIEHEPAERRRTR